MESWSIIYGGKGFVSDDSVSAGGGEIASSSSSKNGLIGNNELKFPWSYGDVENQDFVDLGSSDMMRKSSQNDSIGDVLSGTISTITAPSNAFSMEDESDSKLSTSVVESNCKESSSSLIDLNLGRLNNSDRSFNAEISIPGKRTRGGAFNFQTPYCQVHGCKKDLSSSKDYHKRHKVCKAHSKTAQVLVNGIEQRFCQQCSRFHLLEEFDDDKRSCRKRLAGHNERRRKPQMHTHTGRVRSLFQSFDATRFQGSTFSASPFVCQDMQPSSFLLQQKYEINNSSRLLKLEDGTDFRSQLPIPVTNGIVQAEFHFNLHNSETCVDNGISTFARNKVNANSPYLQDIADANSVSHSVFHNISVGKEDMAVLDLSTTIQGLSDISNSGRALSLLSSQSRSSSTHSSGIPTDLPLIMSGDHSLYPVTQQPEKLLGSASQATTCGMSTSSLMNSMEENHPDPIIVTAGGSAVSSGINVIIQESESMNRMNQFLYEDGSTIDLLQLSSQLQRVEHQRQSLLMKQEEDAFPGLGNNLNGQ